MQVIERNLHMRTSVLIGICLLSSNLLAAEKSVRLVLPAQAGAVVENAGKVFTRQIQQRCEAKVVIGSEAPLTAELAEYLHQRPGRSPATQGLRLASLILVFSL